MHSSTRPFLPVQPSEGTERTYSTWNLTHTQTQYLTVIYHHSNSIHTLAAVNTHLKNTYVCLVPTCILNIWGVVKLYNHQRRLQTLFLVPIYSQGQPAPWGDYIYIYFYWAGGSRSCMQWILVHVGRLCKQENFKNPFFLTEDFIVSISQSLQPGVVLKHTVVNGH